MASIGYQPSKSKMQYLQSWRSVSNVILVSFCYSIAHYHTVIADTYHIVTSTSSPCPGEFIGKPCLSLQQYASSPSQDSNVTLVIESGTHKLQSMEMLITRIDNFIMTAEGAQIVFYVPRAVVHPYFLAFIFSSYHRLYCISNVLTTHIHGIHFSCAIGTVCVIEVMYVQELIIEDCTFQGIEFDLYQITNAVILQSCFYDTSKVSIRSSSAKITGSTFSNNSQAVYYYDPYNNVLIISECTFINNTSAYSEGAAVYISDGRSVMINSSIFVNNIAATGGGALYLDGNFNININI